MVARTTSAARGVVDASPKIRFGTHLRSESGDSGDAGGTGAPPRAELGLPALRDLTEATILVAAAYEAGLVARIADGPATALDVSNDLGYDERATRIVLRALAETPWARERDGAFALTARGHAELIGPESSGAGRGDAPSSRGRPLPQWLRNVRALARLGEALEAGGPLERPGRRTGLRLRRFTDAMGAVPRERVETVVRLCLSRRPGARTLLDLGGGPGVFARGFVEAGLAVTLVDMPEVVEHVADAFGLGSEERIELVGADITRDRLPQGPFDIVLLSNVLHIYDAGTAGAVVRSAADRVSPGGVVAVAEQLLGMSPRAAGLGLRMLLRSEGGEAYDAPTVRGWLAEAGLLDPRVEPIDAERQLVMAAKAE